MRYFIACALAAFCAAGVSIPAAAASAGDFTLVIHNRSSETIYANGGYGTWAWVKSGPEWFQTPIPPGGSIYGKVKYKQVLGIDRSGNAGYALSLNNSGLPPNLVFINLNYNPDLSTYDSRSMVYDPVTGVYFYPPCGSEESPEGGYGVLNTSLTCANLQIDPRLDGRFSVTTRSWAEIHIAYLGHARTWSHGVECAADDWAGNCNASGGGWLWTYGSGGRYTFIYVENVQSVPCWNAYMDPNYMVTKACYLQRQEARPDSFTACASEGQNCSTNLPASNPNSPGAFRRARFGSGSSWAYFWVAAGEFSCGIGTTVGFDPLPGTTKQCELSNTIQQAQQYGWTYCGQENDSCAIPSEAKFLMAYGAQGKWLVREVDASTGMDCDNDAFRSDPAPGQTKSCFLTPLLPGPESRQAR